MTAEAFKECGSGGLPVKWRMDASEIAYICASYGDGEPERTDSRGLRIPSGIRGRVVLFRLRFGTLLFLMSRCSFREFPARFYLAR